MKKLFKRILVSTFAIGASLFIGNKAFAENYKVNIAVVGDQQTGKTQIIRSIFRLPFEPLSDRTSRWDHGAFGRQKQYHIGGDVFECKYYDAPGYLQNPDATLDQQIDSAAVRDANIVLIVVDPQQTRGLARGCKNSIHEALVRHATNVNTINPDCRIIVVANKADTIPEPELVKYNTVMKGAKDLFFHLEVDSVFTSAKEDTGISELVEKIKKLLALNKATFPTFDDRFVDCKCGHCKRRNECVEGYDHDLYCTEACLKVAEAKSCSRQDCTHKDRKFLRCRGEGFTNPRTGEMYCGIECYKKDVGIKCAHQGCDEWFVIADGQDGVDFFTHPKNGKRYCPQHKEDATPGCTLL